MRSMKQRLKKLNKEELIKEVERYCKGFTILNCYFDSISDEEKPKVDKQLKRIGL